MTKHFLLGSALCAVLFSTQHVQAAQPISESMVECSVIYELFSETAAQKNKSAKQIEIMQKSSKAFIAASYVQAKNEKRPDVNQYVDDVFAEKMAHWEDRIFKSSDLDFVANSKDMFDWVQYCGKMGKAKGILPVKDTRD